MMGRAAASSNLSIKALFLSCASGLTVVTSSTTGSIERQIQCYACGLSKVQSDHDDVAGSSSFAKVYNRSCDAMMAVANSADQLHRYLRTCPIGVRSCFAAKGSYDRSDNDPGNDLHAYIFGCSEARYEHRFGCNTEFQTVTVRNNRNQAVQVEVKVNYCFCSRRQCNDPSFDTFSGSGSRFRTGTTRWFASVELLLLVPLSIHCKNFMM